MNARLGKKDVELKVKIFFNMVAKGCAHVIQIKYILKSEMSEIIYVTTNIMQACRTSETAAHKYSSDTKGFQLLRSLRMCYERD